MKTAVVHDWLTGMRGAEKCLGVFCELFPDAELFTLLHIPGTVSETIENRKIHTSFIQKVPGVRKWYRYYLPLFPKAIEHFDMSKFDLIISSSHCVAKGVKKTSDTLHICYCHTPMRYVWEMYDSYFNEERSGIITRAGMSVTASYLRKWDVSSSVRVDSFIANSNCVADRIKRHYGRKAVVIFPPVDCAFYMPKDVNGDYFLIVSAFAPYKKIDLAIEAFNRLGLPLKIVGTGQEEGKLKRMAGSNIEFVGWKSDEELIKYYVACKALIFPGEEDFGIVPVEAMACGSPVIAYGKGGVLDTVIPLQGSEPGAQDFQPTGVFFYEQTVESLIGAVDYFESYSRVFSKNKIREHALKFDRSIFKQRINDFIHEKYEEFLNAKKTH